jgi:2,4-dienoyl-CoA reductase-like NADH-dependent reductase (Old Yellow Enzyme family)
MPDGMVFPGQNGFCNDRHSAAWESTVQEIHHHGAKIIFQIAHAGAAADPAANNFMTRGPSGFLPNSREMTISEIEELIQSYVCATKRLLRISVDGIMIHCAHGYALSQFLSPWANRRTDKYGFSTRTRIVEEIVREVKKIAPADFAIVCKLNGHDCIDGGVTPEICAENVRVLSETGVQMFEISCGFLNGMTMSRATLKEERTFRNPRSGQLQFWKDFLKRFDPEFPFSEAYTRPYAEIVRRANHNVPLAIVGGMRNFSAMEELVAGKNCDLVSLSRPFLRDPYLVTRFYTGELNEVECVSCNQCFCRPVKCYFPPG